MIIHLIIFWCLTCQHFFLETLYTFDFNSYSFCPPIFPNISAFTGNSNVLTLHKNTQNTGKMVSINFMNMKNYWWFRAKKWTLKKKATGIRLENFLIIELIISPTSPSWVSSSVTDSTIIPVWILRDGEPKDVAFCFHLSFDSSKDSQNLLRREIPSYFASWCLGQKI